MKRYFTILFIGSLSFAQDIYVSNISGNTPQETIGRIYKFNLANCTSESIAIGLFVDIALTPNNSLYGNNGGEVFKIDIETGNVIQIGEPGAVYIGANSLVALNDTTLLSANSGHLYAFNVDSLLTTDLGWIGNTSQGDLTWYDNDLYMPVYPGLLERIVLNDDFTSVVSYDIINNENNLLPEFYALATANLPGEGNKLVGFSTDNKAYKICHLDGSFEEICVHGLGSATGAAVARLGIQNPPETDCNNLKVTGYESDRAFGAFPNPVSRSEQLYFHIEKSVGYPVEVCLRNLQGSLIYQNQDLDGNSSLDLFQLNISAGLYVVEFTVGTRTFFRKLLVK